MEKINLRVRDRMAQDNVSQNCFLETVSFTHCRRYQVGKSTKSGHAFALGRVVLPFQRRFFH